MLGKVISGILGVVGRVWGGDGSPRVGLDGFQSIQNAKTCFSIFDFQSCILAFLTFQSFHPNLWCRRRQPASQAGSSQLWKVKKRVDGKSNREQLEFSVGLTLVAENSHRKRLLTSLNEVRVSHCVELGKSKVGKFKIEPFQFCELLFSQTPIRVVLWLDVTNTSRPGRSSRQPLVLGFPEELCNQSILEVLWLKITFQDYTFENLNSGIASRAYFSELHRCLVWRGKKHDSFRENRSRNFMPSKCVIRVVLETVESRAR